MPEARLKLVLELDPESLSQIKTALDGIKMNPLGAGGVAGGSGAASALKEFYEELARIKTAARDAEVEFRRLSLAQKENKATQDDVNKAKERAIAVIEGQSTALEMLRNDFQDNAIAVEKVSIAEKSMVEAKQRVSVGFIGLASSMSAANNTLLEFGRGVSDASMFAVNWRMGLIAVGNNITQTADSVGRLVVAARAAAAAQGMAATATNTFTMAIRQLGASLLGVNGVILAINVAVAALTFWSTSSKKAVEDTDSLSESLSAFGGEFDQLNAKIAESKVKLRLIDASEISKSEDQLKRYGTAIDDLNKKQIELVQAREKEISESQARTDKLLADRQSRINTEGFSSTVAKQKTAELEQEDKKLKAINAKYDEQIAKNGEIIGELRKGKEELESQIDRRRQIESLLGKEVGLTETGTKAKKEDSETLSEIASQLAAINGEYERGVDLINKRADAARQLSILQATDAASNIFKGGGGAAGAEVELRKAEALELAKIDNDVLASTEQKALERYKIEQKYSAMITALYEKEGKDNLSVQERNAIALQSLLTLNNQTVLNNQSASFSARFEAAKANHDSELQSLKNQLETGVITHQEYDLKVEQERQRHAGVMKNINGDIMSSFNAILGQTAQLVGALGALYQQRSEQLKNEAREATDPSIRAKKLAAAKAEFEMSKKFMIAQAVMSTALAVISTVSQTKGGFLVKAAAGSLALALGMLQVKKIREMKFEAGTDSTGGYVSSGGGGGGGGGGREAEPREGFRVDPYRPAATSSIASATAPTTPTTIIINSQLNEEQLSYAVRRGDAIIRTQTSTLQSDAA